MDIDSVAEGVETQVQLNCLCSLGVDYLQGGISAGRKMWIHFVVNMNNSGGVISKLLLKNKNKHI
ncbi:hypothetical protein C4A68_03930 [Escherichia coli]|nr:hypothetical protein [Escherichia coli]RDO82250.1 hypothetical protein C4A68_03930 [Escherichia coli]RDO90616.1 hypothetical protein C4A65_03926 [Escherichia coli]RDO98595.1 hypothetical protein C4A63_04131 [Escherichia coli]